MHLIWRCARLNGLAAFLVLLAVVQPGAQPYNIVSYSLAKGLPQSQVFAMCQDSKGYLWLGTQGGGLSRFDGKRFETFTIADGLPSIFVSALVEDSKQHLWIGTNQGVCRYDGHRFEPVRISDTDAPTDISALALVSGTTVWIGTSRGLFACPVGETTATPINLPGISPPYRVTAIFSEKRGVWVGTEHGAWLVGAHNVRLTEKNGLPGNTVYAFARDDRQQFWLATLGGVVVLDEKIRKVLQTFRQPVLRQPLCLHAGANGSMWVGTFNNSLLCYLPADSSWLQFSERDGFPHPHVRCLLSDRGGRLWAGTSGGGIALLTEQPFRHFDQTHGLGGNRVYALHKDRRGRLWLAVSNNGLQVLDSAGFHAFERDSGYLKVKCKTIAEDSDGRLWVGTEGKGIAIFDSSRMRRLTRQNGLTDDLVQKIIPGARGEMWVATLTAGIIRIGYQSDSLFVLESFGLREGLPDVQVQTLRADTSGRIWFATQSGHVGYLKNGRVSAVFDRKNGLPGVPVRTLTLDANGRIWAGTKGAGILWADPAALEPHFSALDASLKRISPNVYLLAFDAAGNLWSGSETGVDKISLAPSGPLLAGVQHFGRNEGFLGIETCQDAVLEDHLGQLWFGTMNGLTRYVPMTKESTPTPPVLHFESVSLFYKPLADTAWAAAGVGISGGLKLAYFQNHLSFAFQGVDPANPDHIRYRWRLGEAETDWSPLSDQSQVSYAKLAPGAYSFEVQATSDGDTFSAPLAVSFTIKEPFWQLWWFRALLGLAALGLITGIALAWVQRIRRTERARREKLEVENRLLLLEQKALQLQMNPHFIFNALTSIQALITKQNYPTARQEINHFAQLMRSILANSRRPAISLQEEVNTLRQYLQIEQFCHRQSFEFQLELPENIDPEEIEIPPMLLQPFVENAVVHGVAPLPYPGKISIRFSLDDDLLACDIRDNGVGRERAARLREEKKPGHQSAALQVTRERLEALRGKKPYQPLEISDIINEKGEIAGTQVLVRLPAEMKY